MLSLDRFYPVAVLLLPVFLFYGCATPGTEVRVQEPELVREEKLSPEQVQDLIKEGLDSLNRGFYARAKQSFLKAENNSQIPEVRLQARTGFILAGAISARSWPESMVWKEELDIFLDQNQDKIPLHSEVLEFFGRIIIEHRSLEEENVILKDQLRNLNSRLHDLEQENLTLKSQIRDLEELSRLIEQQKRQLLE